MVRAGEKLSASEAQMLRLPALVEALRSSDQNEGVRAFQEKRKPGLRVYGDTCIINDFRAPFA